MWFKNLRIYRLDTAFALSAQQLAEMLAKHQFAPGGSQEPLSLGWVPPRELRHIEPGQFFTLRHDPEVRVLLHKTRTHGHFNNGYASLCHELERSCVIWGENGWEASP